MPGPTNQPRIILLYAEAATTAGPAIGLQGDAVLLAGARTMPLPVEIVVNLVSGTSATVIIETDSAIAFGSAATWATLTLTAANPTRRIVGQLKNIFVRARPSAHVGGTIYATVKLA